MTFPQDDKTANNANIQGEPLDIDFLLQMAEIDLVDVESAVDWFDETASAGWQGALDSEPMDE